MSPRPPSPSRAKPAALAVASAVASLAVGLAACSHFGSPAPSGPSRALLGEASHIERVAYEDDFQEARLVLQALPAGASERRALREKLLHYLLDPVLKLDAESVRREAREIENDDLAD